MENILLIVFMIFFPIFWFSILNGLFKKSGWKDLSKRFGKCPESFCNPNKYYLTGGLFGKVNFASMLYHGASQSGLVIKPMFPFKITMSSLHFGWSEIESIKIQKGLYTGSKDDFLNKIKSRLSTFDYANIKLREYPNQTIVIKWQNEFINFVPLNILFNHNDF